MKTTIRDIIDAHAALAVHGGLSLPPALAFRFAKFMRAVRAEAETVQEVRQGLVEKHGKRDEKGALVRIALPGGGEDIALADAAAFKADHKALMAAPVEIAGEPFKLADLGSDKLPADLLAALADWAVVE